MELDLAAIAAKMSPSLSQSIPTQRLHKARRMMKKKWEKTWKEHPKASLTGQHQSRSFMFFKLTLEGWVQHTCVHVDRIFWLSCRVCGIREKRRLHLSHVLMRGSSLAIFRESFQLHILDSPCNCDVITKSFLPPIQEAWTRPGLLTENENTLWTQTSRLLSTF